MRSVMIVTVPAPSSSVIWHSKYDDISNFVARSAGNEWRSTLVTRPESRKSSPCCSGGGVARNGLPVRDHSASCGPSKVLSRRKQFEEFIALGVGERRAILKLGEARGVPTGEGEQILELGRVGRCCDGRIGRLGRRGNNRHRQRLIHAGGHLGPLQLADQEPDHRRSEDQGEEPPKIAAAKISRSGWAIWGTKANHGRRFRWTSEGRDCV